MSRTPILVTFGAVAAMLAPGAIAAPQSAPLPPELPRVEVVGEDLARREQPGSAQVITADELRSSRTLTVPEALRRASGVHVRDEEGFGLRPNIGIRGLNPTRSTKVLLLEDGLPASYAPYGDNASYYHAPLERYERIEVLKGVGMLRFGPQTIGGAINYVTPMPPDALGGYLQAVGGNLGYSSLRARVGGAGLSLELMRRAGDAARDNQRLRQDDVNLKYVLDLGEDHAVTFKASRLGEDSQVTYSGLTAAEYANFGRRYNPFRNDTFEITRYGGSATHRIVFGPATLLTSAYAYRFDRDWWRQSSTTTDTQCGTAFRDARLRGERVDVDACNSTQGRLRSYDTRGIEPRLSVFHGLGGIEQEFEASLRWHREDQTRFQVNGTSPRARTGTVVEDNRRETRALSAHVANTFRFGNLLVLPIVRFEDIDNERVNRLNGRGGSKGVDAVVPGLGVNWTLSEDLTVFAGWHEGFAPPRVEDLIDNDGGSVDLEPERSRNLEFGLRGRLGSRTTYEAVAFANDFDRQIAVGSVAGGSTPLAVGEARYVGAELALDWNGRDLGAAGGPYARAALTWLPTARQESAFVAVATGLPVGGSAPGNRLPYAPRTMASARLGWAGGPWDASVEVQAIGWQWADFANTIAPRADGQVGRIAGHGVVNAALNWSPDGTPWSAFVTVKNLFDRDYIVDRTRGILPGAPRQVAVGAQYRF
jgi:Fe(3+) dicitrate transport protein